jgi:hypothetical protein
LAEVDTERYKCQEIDAEKLAGLYYTFVMPLPVILLARVGAAPDLRLFSPAPGALDLRFLLPNNSWARSSFLRR